MELTYELFIPENLFDSASNKNNNESLSEKISKAILVNVLKISDDEIVRGNAGVFEPDYICKKQGYEITFAQSSEKIKQLKGIAPLNKKVDKQEESLIQDIEIAINRKVKKKYSVKTTLIVFNLFPNSCWETDFVKPNDYSLTNLPDHILADLWNTKRNVFFNKLFEKYIASKIFSDILIICLTADSRYIVYSVDYFYNKKGYTLYLGIRNFNLPHCKLVEVNCNGPMFPIINHDKIQFGVYRK